MADQVSERIRIEASPSRCFEVATDFESLERRAREHFANVTQEEWDKLPEDLFENLDHYLYGVPKKK